MDASTQTADIFCNNPTHEDLKTKVDILQHRVEQLSDEIALLKVWCLC